MKFRYLNAPNIRVIETFVWDEASGFVQDVPMELAAVLYTYPDPEQFEIAEEDAVRAKAEVEAYIEGGVFPISEEKAEGRKRKKKESN